MSYRIPGKPEGGSHCPNCDFPIEDPKATVMEVAPPSSAQWICPHCGWVMITSRHGVDNMNPRVGHP